MVEVALQINQRGSLRQDSFMIAFRDGVGNFLHVGVPLSGIHIVTDADHFREKRDHRGSFTHSLAVSNLTLDLVQFREAQPQSIDC